MAKIESVSSRERKEILEIIGKMIEGLDDLLPKKGKTTKYLNEKGEVGYLVNRSNLVLIKKNDFYFPCLKIVRKIKMNIPKIIVDLGAIRFVTNGADIMRPGITKIEENILEGSLVLIVEEKNGAALAFGKSLYDAVDMQMMENGRVVENLHYLKDDWFNFEI